MGLMNVPVIVLIILLLYLLGYLYISSFELLTSKASVKIIFTSNLNIMLRKWSFSINVYEVNEQNHAKVPMRKDV